jgi:hypothetical protein
MFNSYAKGVKKLDAFIATTKAEAAKKIVEIKEDLNQTSQ